MLLGLIKLGQGVAVNVLQKLGLDLETVRMEVEKQVGSGPETKMAGNIPYTPRVKKVLVKGVAGKIAAVTTAMQLARHLVVQALPVTNLVVAPSSLVPATSNPTLLRAKALRANVAAPAC